MLKRKMMEKAGKQGGLGLTVREAPSAQAKRARALRSLSLCVLLTLVMTVALLYHEPLYEVRGRRLEAETFSQSRDCQF